MHLLATHKIYVDEGLERKVDGYMILLIAPTVEVNKNVTFKLVGVDRPNAHPLPPVRADFFCPTLFHGRGRLPGNGTRGFDGLGGLPGGSGGRIWIHTNHLINGDWIKLELKGGKGGPAQKGGPGPNACAALMYKDEVNTIRRDMIGMTEDVELFDGRAFYYGYPKQCNEKWDGSQKSDECQRLHGDKLIREAKSRDETLVEERPPRDGKGCKDLIDLCEFTLSNEIWARGGTGGVGGRGGHKGAAGALQVITGDAVDWRLGEGGPAEGEDADGGEPGKEAPENDLYKTRIRVTFANSGGAKKKITAQNTGHSQSVFSQP